LRRIIVFRYFRDRAGRVGHDLIRLVPVKPEGTVQVALWLLLEFAESEEIVFSAITESPSRNLTLKLAAAAVPTFLMMALKETLSPLLNEPGTVTSDSGKTVRSGWLACTPNSLVIELFVSSASAMELSGSTTDLMVRLPKKAAGTG